MFAPEFQAAFFGGDPDNFEYPRYDLDISFFRVYENDKPVHLDNYFKWSRAGVKDGELIFVSGNPGSTGRLNTMSQLEFLRDCAIPLDAGFVSRRAALLKKFSAASPENARIAQEDLFGIENSLKAISGYQSGLTDQALMAKKSADGGQPAKACSLPTRPRKRDSATRGRRLPRPWTCKSRSIFRSLIWSGAAVSAAIWRASPACWCARPRSGPSPMASACANIAIPRCPRSSRTFSPPRRFTNRWKQLVLSDSLQEMKEKMPGDPVVARVLNGKTPARIGRGSDREYQTG